MAQQIVEIGDNVALYKKDPAQGYSAEAGKILMDMQRLALANVIISISTMTMVMAEQAINAMLNVVASSLGGIVKTIL